MTSGRADGWTAEGGTLRPALRRCTGDPDDFSRRVWARTASLTPAGPGAGFDDLFSLADADRLLSQHGLRTPFVRVVQGGATLPSGRFAGPGGVGAGIADQVSDVRLAGLIADGATVVLQALHRTHAPLIDFGQQLGADLGHPVQINAYLTPPRSQGFSAHYDVHDVFVLQVAGEKHWRVHAPVVTAPLPDDPWNGHRAAIDETARGEPVLDVVLRPGDALYLPRGYLHSATAGDGISAHLTVGVHVWTRQHLLEAALAALSADDADLRQSLPLGVDLTDAGAVGRELGATLAHLRPALDGLTGERLLPRLADRALSTSRAEPVSPFAQASAAAAVRAGDRLRWRTGMPAVVTAEGPELAVRTHDGTVRLTAAADGVVARLRAGDELSVGGDGLTTDLAAALLRSCLAVLA